MFKLTQHEKMGKLGDNNSTLWRHYMLLLVNKLYHKVVSLAKEFVYYQNCLDKSELWMVDGGWTNPVMI